MQRNIHRGLFALQSDEGRSHCPSSRSLRDPGRHAIIRSHSSLLELNCLMKFDSNQITIAFPPIVIICFLATVSTREDEAY